MVRVVTSKLLEVNSLTFIFLTFPLHIASFITWGFSFLQGGKKSSSWSEFRKRNPWPPDSKAEGSLDKASSCSVLPPAFKMCNKPIARDLRGALNSKTWSLAALRRYDGIIWILYKRHAGMCPCLTSGSHSRRAVWGDPTARLSPSQSPSSAPSWSPSAPPRSTRPGRPRSATRMLSITSRACYLIRIKQSPAVHSCL